MKHWNKSRQILAVCLILTVLAAMFALSVSAQQNRSMDPVSPAANEPEPRSAQQAENRGGDNDLGLVDGAPDTAGDETDAGVRTGNGDAAKDGEVSDTSKGSEEMFDKENGEVSDTADNVDKADQTGETTKDAVQDAQDAVEKEGSSITGIIIAIVIAVVIVVLVLLLIPRRKDQ